LLKHQHIVFVWFPLFLIVARFLFTSWQHHVSAGAKHHYVSWD
jgi:hypothetical protein